MAETLAEPMNVDRIERFAYEWIEAWNAGDLERLLAHYRDDTIFDSPRAKKLTGAARIVGKDALRAYWGAAIDRASTRRFVLDCYLWDPERNALVILYTNHVDDTRTRACEVFYFDRDGWVERAEALYGAEESVGQE